MILQLGGEPLKRKKNDNFFAALQQPKLEAAAVAVETFWKKF